MVLIILLLILVSFLLPLLRLHASFKCVSKLLASSTLDRLRPFPPNLHKIGWYDFALVAESGGGGATCRLLLLKIHRHGILVVTTSVLHPVVFGNPSSRWRPAQLFNDNSPLHPVVFWKCGQPFFPPPRPPPPSCFYFGFVQYCMLLESSS
jgi:hypothetical protein